MENVDCIWKPGELDLHLELLELESEPESEPEPELLDSNSVDTPGFKVLNNDLVCPETRDSIT